MENASREGSIRLFTNVLLANSVVDEHTSESIVRDFIVSDHSPRQIPVFLLRECELPNEAVILTTFTVQGNEEVAFDLTGMLVSDVAAGTISRERAEYLGVCPLSQSGGAIRVAVPVNYQKESLLREDIAGEIGKSGYGVIPVYSTADQIMRKRLDTYRNGSAIEEITGSDTRSEDAAVRVVDLHLEQAVRDGASDIHFEPSERGMTVRYRIDGVLHLREAIPLDMMKPVLARIKIMADIDTSVDYIPQDGRMRHKQSNRDLRINTSPTVWGEGSVMRILDNSRANADIRSFGMSPWVIDTWLHAINQPQGMVLVTGPTGSGKSTTLYASLRELATVERKVFTAEDPVEYKIPGISQIPVNALRGLTFNVALKAAMRSDPDVILVGEIRDHETAQMAIDAAQTGHLVLSTLHTNSAPGAAVRLSEIGIDSFLVADNVHATLGQRLVRTLCTSCRVEDPSMETAILHEKYGFSVAGDDDTQYFKANPAGCNRCTSGFKGRTGVHEVMTMSEDVRRLLNAKDTPASVLYEAAQANGMVSLLHDGFARCVSGQTSVAEVLRVITTTA